MSQYRINETTLINLGTAIRNKTGITKDLTPNEMIQVVNNLYIPKDILTKKNLNEWTKNIDIVTTLTYENTGIDKINTLKNYIGGSGYERYYLPVTVAKNTTYAFTADFCSPTGFVFKDFDQAGFDGEYIYVLGVEPTTTASPNAQTNGASRYVILGKSKALNTNATNEYDKYIAVFNSGNYTTVYLTISLGYMEDAKAVDLNFKNLALYQFV